MILRRRSILGGGSGLPVGTTYEFNYTGGPQTIVLDKGQWLLEVWGAQGGYRSSSTYGGKGGYSTGILNVTSNLTCYVLVGGSGNTGGTAGGYNGGGSRATYNGGGGGTDIRIGQNSLYARVIVAGGGGSDGASYNPGKNGGGTSGDSATESYGTGGGGGTQTAGGEGGNSNAGTFGQGGQGLSRSSGYAGAGGGGWYGGGGSYPDSSGDDDRGGGGGSGYVYTSATAKDYPTGCLLNSSHYLINASTTGGQRTGDGYAKIIKIGEGKVMTVTDYLLSKGYQTCEYIQSSGTQYIDTEILVDDSYGYYVDFNQVGSGDEIILGVCGQGDSRWCLNSNVFVCNLSWNTIYTAGTIDGRHEVWMNFMNNRMRFMNNSGMSQITETLSSSATTYSVLIFAAHWRSTSVSLYSNTQLFQLKISKENSLVRDYYPVYSQVSGEIGLYDLVSDRFFNNKGTGRFIKGPDYEVTDIIIQ